MRADKARLKKRSNLVKEMRESGDKIIWGRVDKVGKGTRANYNPDKKMLTFAFIRNPQTSSEQLKKLRETLMKELKDLGYSCRMKYNGEVIAENIENQDVTTEKKNHQLIIHLKNKLEADKEKDLNKEPT
jgi:hypothetical protein